MFNLKKIKEFHMKVMGKTFPSQPTIPNQNETNTGNRLISEEFAEYLKAVSKNDIIEVADSLADMIVVICQTAWYWGIDLDAVLEQVHASNMSKIGGKYDEGGKFIKPSTWSPPNILYSLIPKWYDIWKDTKSWIRSLTFDKNSNELVKIYQFVEYTEKGNISKALKLLEEILNEENFFDKLKKIVPVNQVESAQKLFHYIIEKTNGR